MRIVSCFMEGSEIEPLVKAGADELYTSVPGLPSFDDTYLRGIRIEAAIGRIHALGKKALLAVNSQQVVRNARGMRALRDRLYALDDAGADAFIVSSPSILSLLRSGGRKLKADIHLSSVQPCFNTAALKFFLRFAIKRLILPTQLAPLEARELLALCRREGVETEIFDYRFFGCIYVNGRCNLHQPRFHTFRNTSEGGALCRCGEGGSLLRVKPLEVRTGRAKESAAIAGRLALRMGRGGAPRLYNAAAFYDFFRLGAGWLKYGVRKDLPAEKVRKVRQLREMADLAGTLSRAHGHTRARGLFIEHMTGWNKT
jgi:hypothetical protein